MSDQNAGIIPAPASTPLKVDVDGQKRFPIHRSWTMATATAVIMVLLALVGVGLTTANSSFARTYWVSLVPVYAILCVATAWLRARPEGGRLHRVAVIRQGLHWLATALALGLVFFIRGTGEETAAAAALNALLVLAMGCFLAGIHLEWLFAVVGMFLSLTLVVVAKADQYLWLIFVVGGVVTTAMLLMRWLMVSAVRKSASATA
jgi:hypothetical protein